MVAIGTRINEVGTLIRDGGPSTFAAMSVGATSWNCIALPSISLRNASGSSAHWLAPIL